MNLLIEAACALAEEADLERLLDRVLAALVGATRADRGFLALHDGEALRVCAARDADGGRDTRTASRTLLERAFRENRPLVLADVNDDATLSLSRSVQRHRIRAVCAIPLRTPQRAIGVVALDHPAAGVFDDAVTASLEAFAAIAALAIENRRMARDLDRLAAPPPPPATGGPELVGPGAAMALVRDRLNRISSSPYPVHLHGESGTGKEVAARIVHDRGPRAGGPFVAVNCGAVPEPLAESEFFGHSRGAFTGAEQGRAGLFEQADGGTLFLDEVEAMPPFLQDMLLRVVQDGVVRRVGEAAPKHTSVRIITASNERIDERVIAGRFRADLWYRLNVLRVDLPALRDRPGDIPAIVDHLLRRIAAETGTAPRPVDAAAMERLVAASWPGNVRQIENVLRQAVTLAESATLGIQDFPGPDPSAPPLDGLPLLSVEDYIRHCVDVFGPKIGIKRLAERLGVSRKTLWQRKKIWDGP